MTRNPLFSAAAGVCIVLAAPSLPLRAEVNPADLYSNSLPSVATLEVENVAGRHFVGSAFLAMDDRLAVTAWHVVHDARRVEARFADGSHAEVIGVVDKNEQLDLALLKLEVSGRPRLKLDCSTPRIGERVYLIGSPRGYDFSISEGLISQIRTVDGVRYYQVSCPISPGDSGGPVLNERGEAIGVVSWRKADAESLGFAIPSPDVARMNAKLPVVAWVNNVPVSPSPGNQPARAPLLKSKVSAADSQPTPDSYRSFLQCLSAHQGERVAVIIEEQRGKDSRFSFEVPKPALK
jgi:S1-C subfamily serine protease